MAAITSADTVTFDANSPAAAVVTSSAAISASALTLTTGFTGSLTLGSTLTTTGLVTLTQGTLDTNGKTCTLGGFTTSGALTRAFNITNSAITCNTNSAWAMTATGGLTFTSTGSTITITAGFPNPAFGALTYNNIVINGYGGGSPDGVISGVFTCANFTMNTTNTAVNAEFTLANNFTVTTLFTLTGHAVNQRLFFHSNGINTARTITAAAVSLTNVDLADITGAGAATWSGTSLGDAKGNSNITFTTPVTRFGVVAGNWSNTATWSTSTGGAGGATMPLPQDTVKLDANSAAGTYTVDVPRIGADIDCTGFTRTLSMPSTLFTSFGSVTLSSGMTLSQGQFWNMNGTGNNTITSAGKTFGNPILINRPGATYAQQDALICGSTIQITQGTWTTNDFDLTIGANFNVPNGTTFNGGTSKVTFNIVGAGNLMSAGATATINAANTTFIVAAASASTRVWTGGGHTYGTLQYTVAGSTGQLTVTGANTFGVLMFSDASNARTLTLPASTTTTITGALQIMGSAGKLMTVNSSTPGTTATLSKASGTVACDYLSVQDSTASGGAAFYAGYSSTSVSNNSGWIFTAPPNNFFEVL